MFSNCSQSNITISLSSCTPNPHDYVSKQTIPTAELIIFKGEKMVKCNFRAFVHVRALPAVGRCPMNDVAPCECALLGAAMAAPGTAQTMQRDPSPPTPGKLLIRTHHPWSTTQALVETSRNVFLAPCMRSIQTIPILQRFQGLGIPASSLHPSKFMRMLKMWMKAETHQAGRSINLKCT